MSRTLFGTLLGGGAATVYLRPDLVADFAKERALQNVLGSTRSYSTTAGNSREIEQLTKLVEQLSRDVQNSKQGVTIVHSGPGGKNGSVALVGVAVAGLGMVYLMVFRGWRVSDFFYVTRRGLKQGIEQVTKGLDDLRGRLDHWRTALQEKIAVLMRKQDATIATQREMQGQLHNMHEDVDTIRSQVGQIHGLVLDVSSGLSEVGANQRHANQGIYILCKAVGELMQGHNIPSKKELLEYTQHPIWTADKLQGLEGILCNISDNTEPRRGGGSMLLEGVGGSPCRALTYGGGGGGGGGEPSLLGEPTPFGSVGAASCGDGPNGYGFGNGMGAEGPRGGPQPAARVHHSQSFTFGSHGANGAPPNLGRVSPPPFGGGIIATGLAATARGSAPDPW